MKTETAEKNVDKKKKTVSEEEESKQAEACASEPVPEESAEEKLKAELEQANANAEDFKRKWYSVSAEYENYRKRTASVASQKYAEGWRWTPRRAKRAVSCAKCISKDTSRTAKCCASRRSSL